MRVVDHQCASWYLFEEAGVLLLDVNCDHSAVGYCVLIPLSGEEEAEYALKGREYLNELARNVHMGGPGSYHQRRDVSATYSSEAMLAAIEVWRTAHPQDQPGP